jgi:hypothetical protein
MDGIIELYPSELLEDDTETVEDDEDEEGKKKEEIEYEYSSPVSEIKSSNSLLRRFNPLNF